MKSWWKGVGFGIGISMLFIRMMQIGGYGQWGALEVNHWTVVAIGCSVFLMMVNNPWRKD